MLDLFCRMYKKFTVGMANWWNIGAWSTNAEKLVKASIVHAQNTKSEGGIEAVVVVVDPDDVAHIYQNSEHAVAPKILPNALPGDIAIVYVNKMKPVWEQQGLLSGYAQRPADNPLHPGCGTWLNTRTTYRVPSKQFTKQPAKAGGV